MTETAAAINQITANIQSIKSRVINQSASERRPMPPWNRLRST
jgi:hypothetical protein